NTAHISVHPPKTLPTSTSPDYARTPSSTNYFMFNHTATTENYTLSLHDALPILSMTSTTSRPARLLRSTMLSSQRSSRDHTPSRDRKSTRLNSSHVAISYAVFCLKKKSRLCRLCRRRLVAQDGVLFHLIR